MIQNMTRGFVWALRYFWPLVFYEIVTAAAARLAGREHLWLALFGGAALAAPVFYAVYRFRQSRKKTAAHAPDSGEKTVMDAPESGEKTAGDMPGLREILFRFAAGAVLGCVLNLFMAVSGLSRYAGSYEQAAEYMFAMPVMLQLLGMCILAPLAEELMFRALAYGQLRETWSVRTAAILSALYFGAAHGNPAQGVYGFLMGLFLAKSYEETGLAGSFAMHMGANAAAVLMSLFWGM